MSYKEGDKATVKFTDGSQAEIFVKRIDHYSSWTNVWFDYEDDETNRQLMHDQAVENDGHFCLLPPMIDDIVDAGTLIFKS